MRTVLVMGVVLALLVVVRGPVSPVVPVLVARR